MWCVKSTEGGLNGGCDVEMHIQNYYKPKKVKQALKNHKVTMEQIEQACICIVRTMPVFEEQRKELPHYDEKTRAFQYDNGYEAYIATDEENMISDAIEF